MKEKKIVGKPFQKGHDPRRNVNGRPIDLPPIDDLIAELLSEEQNDMTALTAMIKAIRNKAIKGDVKAFETLIERVWGKPKQFIQQDVRGGFIIQVGNDEQKNIIDNI